MHVESIRNSFSIHLISPLEQIISLTFPQYFFGLVLFLAGRIWILFSIVSLAVAIPSLVVCVLIYLGVIYEQTKCVRALYQAKHDFWAGQRVEGDDARTA